MTKIWSKTDQFCSANRKNLNFLSVSLQFLIIGTKRTPMRNFSFKNIGFTFIMNGMGTILRPKLLNLHSKLLEACALFGCSHISGYIKLSLVSSKVCHCFRVMTIVYISSSYLHFGHLTKSIQKFKLSHIGWKNNNKD